MPEIVAAHLERVARELARINGVHLCPACGHRRGEHAMDLVGEHFCEHNDGSGTDCCNCQSYVGVTRPNYAELVAALECAAAALAACARESEKPWREGIAAIIAKFTEFRDDNKERYEKHSWNQAFQAMAVYDEALKDLRALERAVGEKGK